MKSLIVLFALVCTGVFGQESPPAGPNPVTETVFVPPVSYVGDLVEARVTLLLPEGKTLLPPLSLPTQDWLLFRDVQIRHDPPFERILIKYIPFAPGAKTLPPLVLGDLTLDGIRITTNSLLEKDPRSELLPPRDQLVLPHTELVVLGLIFLVIIVPLASWRLYRPTANLVQRFWKHTERRRTWRQVMKDLRKLQGEAMALSGPDFYTQLSQLIRRYLGQRFGTDFGTLTAEEVQSLLQALPPAWTAEWVNLVRRADVVRFDAREPLVQERLDDLQILRAEIGKLEGKEAPHVDV